MVSQAFFKQKPLNLLIMLPLLMAKMVLFAAVAADNPTPGDYFLTTTVRMISGRRPLRGSPNVIGPIARANGPKGDQVALPCCRNQFGTLACRGLRRSQADIFEYRCLNDHDFHTIDCCMECRDYIETHKIHPQNAKPIFKAPWHCKDTHSFAFCRKFRTSGMGKYSCSTPEFAMRVCRMTCGYCDDKLYSYDKAAPPC